MSYADSPTLTAARERLHAKLSARGIAESKIDTLLTDVWGELTDLLDIKNDQIRLLHQIKYISESEQLTLEDKVRKLTKLESRYAI